MKVGINFKSLDMRSNDLEELKNDLTNYGYKSNKETDFFIQFENKSESEKIVIKIFKSGDFTFYSNYKYIEKIDSNYLTSLLTKSTELLDKLRLNHHFQAKFHQKINFLFFEKQKKEDIDNLKSIIREITKDYFIKPKIKKVFQNNFLLKFSSYLKIENTF